jgi:hypothetical protein
MCSKTDDSTNKIRKITPSRGDSESPREGVTALTISFSQTKTT